MHELLLLGQVPRAQHEQLLKIIAGVAGMDPVRVTERHLMFRPKRTPTSKDAPIGASQGVQNEQHQVLQGQLKGEMFYVQLVGELVEPFSDDEPDVPHMDSIDGILEQKPLWEVPGEDLEPGASPYLWSLCFYDLPEVSGRRTATSRMISKVEIVGGDAMGFMDAMGYRYLSEYALEGHRVIHNNVIILLHRLLRAPGRRGSKGDASAHNLHDHMRAMSLTTVPDYESWTPIDSSGTYLLQASVRVQDGSKPESMTIATNELDKFKEMMKGVVELDAAERLAMDTRVR